MISETLKQLVSGAMVENTISPVITSETKFGDYATNVAFLIDRANAKSVAEDIVSALLKLPEAKAMIEQAEVAEGFINITLTLPYIRKAFWERVGEKVQITPVERAESISIEALSANPTGPLHVGNGRAAFFGDVLGNVLARVGHEVTREYYLNNARVSVQIKELGKTALGHGEKYKTPYLEEKIAEVQDALESVNDESEAGYILASHIIGDQKKFLEERTKLHYDLWVEEEDLYKRDLPRTIFDELVEKKLVYEAEGASWLKTTEFGDDKDKVLRRSDGTFGYYMADIAYHKDKVDRGYDRIINILGADHHGHVKPMEVAMEILKYAGTFTVLLVQLVRVKGGGRLSKREGNLVYLGELIDEVGLDATRFFYLMRSLSSQMEFDIELAKEQSQKNPVYYVQYTHARTHGIVQNNVEKDTVTGKDLDTLAEQEERDLMLKLLQYEDTLHDVARTYYVHHLTKYAMELATAFNTFYEKHRVLVEENDTRRGRLALVTATQHVLEDCLTLLGVSAPEHMEK